MPIIAPYSDRVLEIRRRLEIPADVFHAELAKVATTLGPPPVAVPPAVEPSPPVIQPEPTFESFAHESDEDYAARSSAHPSLVLAVRNANSEEQARYVAEQDAFQSYQDYVTAVSQYLSHVDDHMRKLRNPETSPSPPSSPPPSRKRRRVTKDSPSSGGRLKRNGKSLGKSKAELGKDLVNSGPREKACSNCIANGMICLPDPKGKGACKHCRSKKIKCALPTPPLEIPPEVAGDLHALLELLSKTCVSLGDIQSALESHSLDYRRNTKSLDALTRVIQERFPVLASNNTLPPSQPQSATPSSSLGAQGLANAYNSTDTLEFVNPSRVVQSQQKAGSDHTDG